MFSHLETLTLRASFVAKKEGRLPPYLGSTLRGIIGHCMRDFVCPTPKVLCHQCNIRHSCSYAQTFCSPGNEGGAVNPFVLHPLVRGKTVWQPGDICSFDLTLIGEATGRAGLLLDTFQAMGERGWGAERLSFALEQVVDPIRGRLIYSSGKTWMRNLQPISLNCTERPATAALVRFDTPVRILLNRTLCHSLSFPVLIQSIVRRVALLSQAYSQHLVHWDEEGLLNEARKVRTIQQNWQFVDFERYSMNRKDNKLNLPAIEGWACYEGDLTPFTPLLEAGTLLHAGKNSTIGFGHFSVIYDK
ncbi:MULTISPECIES: CRISPR system precrRNA processing endoribonuclease RAMP protein Cas6 [Cohnella]|uniref:CRISPR system precrRNA processing endoribonuclease RAMP protein Cas6 n=1 Tax=Cohnella TaxID=329857 RepID=UPI0009BAA149|nr:MULTISPECIES: CRISPR system precrRNA processing endoribonuclease RAMP protein Cas6 [Cohnella]MBN2982175.1 CRISPR system precrRNA processing endoribonuclease RAMP protein Cas6 [Cohnella algarum]